MLRGDLFRREAEQDRVIPTTHINYSKRGRGIHQVSRRAREGHGWIREERYYIGTAPIPTRWRPGAERVQKHTEKSKPRFWGNPTQKPRVKKIFLEHILRPIQKPILSLPDHFGMIVKMTSKNIFFILSFWVELPQILGLGFSV